MSNEKNLLLEDLMLSLSRPTKEGEENNTTGSAKDPGLKNFLNTVKKFNAQEDKKFVNDKKKAANNKKK